MAKPEVLKATPVKGKGHECEYVLSNQPTPFVPKAQSFPLDTRLLTHVLCIHPEEFCANISVLTNKSFSDMVPFYTHSSIP